ncbi:MAG TPA: TetR/AcrR family transcriptional regulator [Kofleriaceae bacterium]|nr:TetR/AcrR family transcriptional regulator [Kofleriaceae bacterium]
MIRARRAELLRSFTVIHRRLPPTVRKQPHQERARVTMEAIIIAATRVIERDGLDRLTTTRIAEIAGVSIGSLYQYFDSREAILGAIIDRQLDAMLVSFRQLVDALVALPLEAMVRGVLFGLLEASREHEKLHGPLYEEMSAARRNDCHARTLDAYACIVASTLVARRDVAVADPQIAARLLVHASHGVIRELVRADGSQASDMLEESARMVVRYLARPN